METLDSGRWSDLPVDILTSLFERPKDRSPLLLLSPEEGGCRLYNPEEDRVYVPTRRDFSGCRFLGCSNLPRLELVSNEGCVHSLEPLGDGDFHETLVGNSAGIRKSAEELRGRVWVGRREDGRLRCDLSGKDGFEDVIEQPTFTWYKPIFESKEEEEGMRAYKFISESENIAVTRSGEVLLVHNYTYQPSTTTFRMFRVFKRQLKNLEDPKTYKPWLLEVDSLGDEALFLDLVITVPADTTSISPVMTASVSCHVHSSTSVSTTLRQRASNAFPPSPPT
ncbi:hypothetical protein Bca4012_014752 [Brassica carinata]